MNEGLKRIVRRFPGVRIAVVGDFVADLYVHTRPRRLSREAPVIICEYESEELLAGSAGNTAMNALKLGADVRCIGVIGDDAEGRRLASLLRKEGADTRSLLRARGRRTTTKTRIMAGDLHTIKQQVIRIDRHNRGGPTAVQARSLTKGLARAIPRVQALIVSDYDDSTLAAEVISVLNAYAGRLPLIVDSRSRLPRFSNAFVATPNETEALELTGMTARTARDLVRLGECLRRAVPAKHILLTRGNHGMVLYEQDRPPCAIPIVGSDEIVDVTGAGDTVAAALTLAIASGASLREAAWIANCAASVTVMKPGASALTRDELLDAIESAGPIRT